MKNNIQETIFEEGLTAWLLPSPCQFLKIASLSTNPSKSQTLNLKFSRPKNIKIKPHLMAT